MGGKKTNTFPLKKDVTEILWTTIYIGIFASSVSICRSRNVRRSPWHSVCSLCSTNARTGLQNVSLQNNSHVDMGSKRTLLLCHSLQIDLSKDCSDCLDNQLIIRPSSGPHEIHLTCRPTIRKVKRATGRGPRWWGIHSQQVVGARSSAHSATVARSILPVIPVAHTAHRHEALVLVVITRMGGKASISRVSRLPVVLEGWRLRRHVAAHLREASKNSGGWLDRGVCRLNVIKLNGVLISAGKLFGCTATAPGKRVLSCIIIPSLKRNTPRIEAFVFSRHDLLISTFANDDTGVTP